MRKGYRASVTHSRECCEKSKAPWNDRKVQIGIVAKASLEIQRTKCTTLHRFERVSLSEFFSRPSGPRTSLFGAIDPSHVSHARVKFENTECSFDLTHAARSLHKTSPNGSQKSGDVFGKTRRASPESESSLRVSRSTLWLFKLFDGQTRLLVACLRGVSFRTPSPRVLSRLY